MAASRIPTTQLYSHEFLNCAGSVLFRRTPTGTAPAQICFLYHPTKDEWLLPKGRQDRGEHLSHTALRETFEETGYPCRLLPVDMITRATEPGVDSKDRPILVKNCTEPFTVSLRHVAVKDMKLIWWFIAVVPQTDGEARENTQMRSENFKAVFSDIDGDLQDETVLDGIAGRLTYTNDREIVKAAIKLVVQTYPQWFSK